MSLVERLVRLKPVLLLLSIDEEEKSYVSSLARKTRCTYSHVAKLMEIFKKAKLVEFKKEGKKKLVKLTPFGKEIVSHFEKVLNLLQKV